MEELMETIWIFKQYNGQLDDHGEVVLEPPVRGHVFSQSALGGGEVELEHTEATPRGYAGVWRATRRVVRERPDGTAVYFDHETGERRTAESFREAVREYRKIDPEEAVGGA